MQTHQHAVITGGSGSLAQAIGLALQSPDWKIETPGREILDVTNQDLVTRYFSEKKVDLLVCAAGITDDAPLARTSTTSWDRVWNVNFVGAKRCAQAVLPAMCRQQAGHLIFISSHSAIHPPIGQTAYAAAKAALIGMTHDLAQLHGCSNIRVNVILPGFLETRMTAKVAEKRRKEVLNAHHLGRFNTCDSVASFIRFLHHQLPHTSGQLFQLDSRSHRNG